MTTTATVTRSSTRTVLRWVVSFTGFPLGGLAAMLLVGPAGGLAPALAAGLVTGVVLGAVQAWALRLDRSAALTWVAATAAGLASGLALGASLVSFGTTAGELALQGAVSGAVVGLAQAIVLAGRLGVVAAAWPAYVAGVWALGWTLTTAVGVDVERHWTVFGAAGALTAAVLTAVLPLALERRSR